MHAVIRFMQFKTLRYDWTVMHGPRRKHMLDFRRP